MKLLVSLSEAMILILFNCLANTMTFEFKYLMVLIQPIRIERDFLLQVRFEPSGKYLNIEWKWIIQGRELVFYLLIIFFWKLNDPTMYLPMRLLWFWVRFKLNWFGPVWYKNSKKLGWKRVKTKVGTKQTLLYKTNAKSLVLNDVGANFLILVTGKTSFGHIINSWTR